MKFFRNGYGIDSECRSNLFQIHFVIFEQTVDIFFFHQNVCYIFYINNWNMFKHKTKFIRYTKWILLEIQMRYTLNVFKFSNLKFVRKNSGNFESIFIQYYDEISWILHEMKYVQNIFKILMKFSLFWSFGLQINFSV